MDIEIPAQIGVDGLIEDIHHIGAAHGHMVLESVLADIFHQLLQVIHLRDSDTSVHAVGVVGNLSLAEIGLDFALGIVGRDAEERERAFELKIIFICVSRKILLQRSPFLFFLSGFSVLQWWILTFFHLFEKKNPIVLCPFAEK